MHASPRLRRLKNDLAALKRLQEESSVFSFSHRGNPPQIYQIRLRGKSLYRHQGKVRPIEEHRIEIKLGSSYPRTMPEIHWSSPIFHPNISEIGMVCLGGYGTHWVPSIQLDELCSMLWDMARFHNYDIRSPYNRDAALWAANQTTFLFPVDARPLRDLRVAMGRLDHEAEDRTGRVGRESQERGVSGRVRTFIQRYGRLFGSDPDPTASFPVQPQAHSRVETQPPQPSPPERASAESPPERPASAPEPDPLESGRGETTGAEEGAGIETEPRATETTGPASQPIHSGEELVILEVVESNEPRSLPRDEEILFID
jgi:ubiquitin-protein ligase